MGTARDFQNAPDRKYREINGNTFEIKPVPILGTPRDFFHALSV